MTFSLHQQHLYGLHELTGDQATHINAAHHALTTFIQSIPMHGVTAGALVLIQQRAHELVSQAVNTQCSLACLRENVGVGDGCRRIEMVLIKPDRDKLFLLNPNSRSYLQIHHVIPAMPLAPLA